MDVASTTFLSPSAEGIIALLCCWGVSIPYNGIMAVAPSESPSISEHLIISACPGRNASMSPLCSRWAIITAEAT